MRLTLQMLLGFILICKMKCYGIIQQCGAFSGSVITIQDILKQMSLASTKKAAGSNINHSHDACLISKKREKV